MGRGMELDSRAIMMDHLILENGLIIPGMEKVNTNQQKVTSILVRLKII